MKKWKRWLIGMVIACVAVGMGALGINGYVVIHSGKNIVSAEEAEELEADCVLVLGCYVAPDGTPSLMLRDRLAQGVALYQAGAAPKLLMSGDHGREEYDEVNAMKTFALEAGVPSQDVFMDHAGFSTYESLYRAKEVFGVRRVIIVTQKYHLYRALYIAQKLGLQAVGVAADEGGYAGQLFREAREILARNKDFFIGIFRPEPTRLGEMIPIFGDGDVTNDARTAAG